MARILVVGSSGHAGVVLDILLGQGLYEVAGFLDTQEKIGSSAFGFRVLGTEHDLPRICAMQKVSGVIVAIGDNFLRYQVAATLKSVQPGIKFVSAIHPSVNLGSEVTIGDGSVVMAGVTLNRAATVGQFCILNTNSSLDHESTLEDYGSIGPMATVGGSAHIGRFTAIGIGATVLHGIRVGCHSVIGAGSVLTSDVPDCRVAYGVPCKIRRERLEGEKYL